MPAFPVRHGASRRPSRGTSALAVVLLTIGAAGCGSGDSESGSSPAERAVKYENGSVKIPSNPKRVALVDWQLPFAVHDLGVTPVARVNAPLVNVPQRYVDGLKDVPQIGDWNTLDKDKLLRAEPDVIITAGMLKPAQIKAFDKIAPVVDIGHEGGWTGIQKRLSEVLNRGPAYATMRKAFSTKASNLKKEYGDVLRKRWVQVGATADKQWLVPQRQTPSGVMLTALGANLHSLAAPNAWWSKPMSTEQLGKLADADLVLYPSLDGKNPDPLVKGAVWNNKLFRTLPAVKDGRTYPFQGDRITSYRWATEELGRFAGTLKQARIDLAP